MSNRFEYETIRGKEFADALDSLGVSKQAFSRITGTKLSRVNDWLRDKTEHGIPPWVPLVLRLLALPGAIGVAKACAAEFIYRDNLRPERGEFPYQAAGPPLPHKRA